jgi:alpha-tubulin suppressor-like RCC1 family protein
MKGCGSAYNGCLMTENKEEDITSLKEIPSYLHKIEEMHIVCGSRHCIAFKNDKCYMWGEHLIEGSEKEQVILEPVEINLKFQISQVACGFDHTLLLD